MAMDWLSAGSSAVNALVGGIGSNAASQAQQDALNQANRMNRSGYLTNTLLQEVPRSVGYQAYGDIASVLGYSLPEYQTTNQLMAAMNPLTGKQVAKLVKSGMSAEQIGQMGTLAGLTPKSVKRLQKVGLTMDQIQALATRSTDATGSSGATQTPAAADAGGTQDFSRFYDSPDYQFRLNEGLTAVDRSAAARGGALSGNALRASNEYAQNIVSNEFNNWYNRRLNLAQGGDAASNNVANAASNYSNAYSQNRQAYGDARASGILGVAGSIQGGLSGVAGAYSPSGWNSSYYGSGYFNPNQYAVNVTPNLNSPNNLRAPTLGG